MAIALEKSYYPLDWDLEKQFLHLKMIRRRTNETGAGLRIQVLQNKEPITPDTEILRLRYKTTAGVYEKIDATVSETFFLVELDALLAGRTEDIEVDLELEVNGIMIGSPTFGIQIKD